MFAQLGLIRLGRLVRREKDDVESLVLDSSLRSVEVVRGRRVNLLSTRRQVDLVSTTSLCRHAQVTEDNQAMAHHRTQALFGQRAPSRGSHLDCSSSSSRRRR